MTQSEENLIRQAETAWLRDDLESSTRALRAAAGTSNSVVTEAAFLPQALPSGIFAETLSFNGRNTASHLVHFTDLAAVFDIGVPLSPDGTFYSRVFSHLKYPERYTHLFTEDTSAALTNLFADAPAVSDGYIALIRPPYYHWLLDTLPHLLGAARLGHRKSVNLIGASESPPNAWQRELLSRAAGLFRIHNLNWLPATGTALRVAPGYAQTRMPLAERLRLLSYLMPAGVKNAGDFLYVRRGAGEVRQLHNEAAVIEALGTRFRTIEPGNMSIDDQIRAFAGARCVVGVHGSNLTNIVFCAPGTAIIEIAAGLPQPHFEQISATAGLRLQRVTAAPVGTRAETGLTWAQAHGDLTVRPQDVVSAVDAALSGGASA